jgi:hypothetical protein
MAIKQITVEEKVTTKKKVTYNVIEVGNFFPDSKALIRYVPDRGFLHKPTPSDPDWLTANIDYLLRDESSELVLKFLKALTGLVTIEIKNLPKKK